MGLLTVGTYTFREPKQVRKVTESQFDEFVKEMRELLDGTAHTKGYNSTGVDGHNQLYSFIQSYVGPGHAIGEIIYKAVRYLRKKDKRDIIKVAAWAYLVWRYDDTN